VASRVETAVTMRSVTNSMGSVVKGMDKAMESMNLERVSGFRLRARGLFGTEVGAGIM
jgi:division protein CdvB (Snf7/Vps24/ESCRT-III family)